MCEREGGCGSTRAAFGLDGWGTRVSLRGDERMTGNVEQELRLANLMRTAHGGDSNAYAELLRSLAPLIRKTVRQRFRFMQVQDIEDLTQVHSPLFAHSSSYL
jgi:hypothetical protein